jgi:hypothetical protein
MAMDRTLIRALNQWRFAQPVPMDPPAAILELLKHALQREGFLPPEPERTSFNDPAVDALMAAFEEVAQAQ